MKFERLRIAGFKSFVEPTEFLIEPGLTAVVGPNGCGKSNLFDALRWVMGEHRATQVRGTGMEDVIFAGSATRPARNVAEVSIFIDNSDHTAGPPYTDCDSIEVSRRIERDAGSVYRINGRDVRQRDVQIFFADASSGAGSTAFVRQGTIGQLVSSRPQARRAVLEEAAGISGLYQRRHEAEIRLKAAETNMDRLADVLAEVESQLASLKRQARLAARYRNLSGHIRVAMAVAQYLRWQTASGRAAQAAVVLKGAMLAVEDATKAAAEASTRQTQIAAALPPLREREAEKSAIYQRLIRQRESLDAEEARSREEGKSLRQRMEQTARDREREASLDKDAGAAIATLDQEAAELQAAQQGSGSEITAAETETRTLAAALSESEKLLEKLTSALADHNAREASFVRARRTSADLATSNERQLVQAQARFDQAMAASADAPNVEAAEAEVAQARARADVAAKDAAEAREKQQAAEKAEQSLRVPQDEAERALSRLSAEAKALGDLLRSAQGKGKWSPLVDSVSVEPGMEAALGAALGDDLEAPVDEAAPHYWRDLGPFEKIPALPQGATPLSSMVKAPSALARCLSMIGVIDAAVGNDLQKTLLPGQRLVSKRGDVWRWDGFKSSADAPSAEAVRLAQRNRLSALKGEVSTAESALETARTAYAAARTETQKIRQIVRDADTAERTAQREVMTAQDTANRAARAAAQRASKLAALEAEIRRLTDARDRAREAEKQAADSLAELGDSLTLTQQASEARGKTGEARAASANARAKLDGLKRDQANRSRRLMAIDHEKTRWKERNAAAAQHIAELDARLADLQSELKVVEAKPEIIAAERAKLLDAISKAETVRKNAADTRMRAEHQLAEADQAAKTTERALSSAREARARAEAKADAEKARLEELVGRIRDELDAAPEDLPGQAEIKSGEALPSQEKADLKVEKLKAEREKLGGVNLRAEDEAKEAEERLNSLTHEREDLLAAIEKLRRGISSLNQEGRARLAEAFGKVNENFQNLFAKLFQGGEARLTFTESEDPLSAGLEIFARPPGKRLQSLSLLSGGEQALTAMALVFAVFLVNPAPVCVLDEVDAPLDDANVERFCVMMDEMTRITQTRFLVITHHALTMSRMHRLFGVTMSERGVSQLVSVSLSDAEKVAAA